MENQLHKNHSAHLGNLKQQILLAHEMLKNPELDEQNKEALWQGMVISQMMFEQGLDAFKR